MVTFSVISDENEKLEMKSIDNGVIALCCVMCKRGHIKRVGIFWCCVDTVGVNLLCDDVEIFVAIFVHSLQPVAMISHELN